MHDELSGKRTTWYWMDLGSVAYFPLIIQLTCLQLCAASHSSLQRILISLLEFFRRAHIASDLERKGRIWVLQDAGRLDGGANWRGSRLRRANACRGCRLSSSGPDAGNKKDRRGSKRTQGKSRVERKIRSQILLCNSLNVRIFNLQAYESNHSLTE